MTILDIAIIFFVLLGAFIGYKQGAITSILNMVGTLLIFIISFYLKGPVSMILFEAFPFNIQTGIFAGISSINFLLYEGIAFIICEIVLSLIFKIVLRVTKVFNKIVNKLVILAIPNKIIGAAFGALRYFIFGFFILFVCSLIPYTSKYIKDSKFSLNILNNTPILTNITKDFNHSIKDIYALIDKYDDETEVKKEEIDYDTLDILLKYDVISVDTLKKMNNNGKINIDNIDELINKYSK